MSVSIDNVQPKAWFASELEQQKSIECSVVKIVVTKKIATQYKYVVNFLHTFYFVAG